MGRVSGFIEGMTLVQGLVVNVLKMLILELMGFLDIVIQVLNLTMVYYKDSEIFLDKGDMIYV